MDLKGKSVIAIAYDMQRTYEQCIEERNDSKLFEFLNAIVDLYFDCQINQAEYKMLQNLLSGFFRIYGRFEWIWKNEAV